MARSSHPYNPWSEFDFSLFYVRRTLASILERKPEKTCNIVVMRIGLEGFRVHSVQEVALCLKTTHDDVVCTECTIARELRTSLESP